jgi:hypothetical protein
MSQPQIPVIFAHQTQPDWGHGIVLEERSDRLVLQFEHGGQRVFLKRLASALTPVPVDEDGARALDAKLRGRRQPPRASAAGAKGAKKKKAAGSKAPVFASFEAQLAWFEEKFPGGFHGDRFVREERGTPEATGKGGYKTAAIALAQSTLSPERFANDAPEVLFENARKVLGATNIVFPQEGPIPFAAIPDAEKPGVVEALRTLLHGEGDYGDRLERLTSRVPMHTAEGKPRSVTWPLATIFGALYDPSVRVAVKPTYFSWQAALVGLEVSKSQPVTAAGYGRFLEVARAIQEKLVAAGHPPRDLMDVYSFIWRTHAEKPAPEANPA